MLSRRESANARRVQYNPTAARHISATQRATENAQILHNLSICIPHPTPCWACRADPRAGARPRRPPRRSRPSGGSTHVRGRSTHGSLVAENRDGMSMGATVPPGGFVFALLNVTVQRASRCVCLSLAALVFQSLGLRPSLIAAFSSSVLRCLGAAI